MIPHLLDAMDTLNIIIGQNINTILLSAAIATMIFGLLPPEWRGHKPPSKGRRG